jgi:hypothetical protein
MQTMTPRQIDRRIIAGRQALAAWAKTGGDIERAQILAELGALEALSAVAPQGKRTKIEKLIARNRRSLPREP